MSNVIHNEQKLKPGQIIQGKILKLYPNNKAQIQLGSKTLVAQLKVSLLLGEHYVFQVETNNDMLQLKVITNKLESKSPFNAADLIRSLGLRVSNPNITMIQGLINEQIPFNKTQLATAFQLLEGVNNKQAASEILKQMIAQKTPLTEGVFSALFTKKTTSLTDAMSGLLKELQAQPNPTEPTQSIMDRLTEMTKISLDPKNQLVTKILSEVTSNNQKTFMSLKTAGLVKSELDFPTWKADWETFAHQNNIVPSSVTNEELNKVRLPYALNEGVLNEALTKLQENKTALQSVSQTFISKWSKTINRAFISELPLPASAFNDLENEVKNRLLPLLPQLKKVEVLTLLENKPNIMRQLLLTTQSFTSASVYKNNEQLLTSLLPKNSNEGQAIKTDFLLQLSQVLSLTGLTDENLLAQRLTEDLPSLSVWSERVIELAMRETPLTPQEQTTLKQEIMLRVFPLLTEGEKISLLSLLKEKPLLLSKITPIIQSVIDEEWGGPEPKLKSEMSLKSMLIQTIERSESINPERSQQLLHLINGLQLESIKESPHFIQASIQMPGEKLHLNNDLHIEFESQKTEEGKINTDFCRIIFYLDLQHLEETIIDMHIQNRLISVTVFNDEKYMPKEFKLLQPLLKEGLSVLDYQLSRVLLKPLHNVKEPKVSRLNYRENTDKDISEGIDFQV